ncbi:Spo0B domain-containing protein [Jeotgalibacillus sp. ET6]|uniref:Spo0B domain-containing protein n=1 Tax=Jeotgalibacillus sp. ET6 TaxID=3037260 RepID=UPI0024184E50|nr:Spo0B domain-containing protein [Jeotgalibacillus sp. ET6]MDG5470938.1 Spo0B domain-containing protein [Jeotgalibacillus sp. ET6]
MKDATHALELLQHSRHDWMNRLQMIKGNLELENIDRAKEIIEEIIIEARQEAQLSLLGAPMLCEWLLTYNWKRRSNLCLKFELLNQGKIPQEMDSPIFSWLESTVGKIESMVPDRAGNELYLIFQVNEGSSSFIITLEYEGGPLNSLPASALAESEGPQLKWNDCSEDSFIVQTSFSWAEIQDR